MADRTAVVSGASLGTVVVADLQAYAPPQYPPNVVEKTDYVPLEFAQSRIQGIEQDSNAVKAKYDERLAASTGYFQVLLEKTKKHYEGFIVEVKEKAVMQSQLLKRKFQVAEEKHGIEVKEKENLIEELRDNFANASRMHQDEKRALKAQQKALEDASAVQVSLLNDSLHRTACAAALADLADKIELANVLETNALYASKLEAITTELAAVQRDFRSQLILAQGSASALHEQHFVRSVCSQTLGRLLDRIEHAHWQEIEQRLRDLEGRVVLARSQHRHSEITRLAGDVIQGTVQRLSHASKQEQAAGVHRRLATLQQQVNRLQNEASIRNECTTVLLGTLAAVEKAHWASFGGSVTRKQDNGSGLGSNVVEEVGAMQVSMQHDDGGQTATSQGSVAIAAGKSTRRKAAKDRGVAFAASDESEPPVSFRDGELGGSRDDDVRNGDINANSSAIVNVSDPESRSQSLSRALLVDQATMTDHSDLQRSPSRRNRSLQLAAGQESVDNGSNSDANINIGVTIDGVEAEGIGAAAGELLPLQPRSEDDEKLIESLEDQLYDLKQEMLAMSEDKRKTEEDRAFVQHQLETLISAKRTDVVKRYEEEIEQLTRTKKEQTEEMVILKTEKTKLESKLKELLERSDAAERELKDRDDRELSGLSVQDEKAQLKSTINKQRQDIVMKSKAATAGWDAAADADERLELQVERAYNKGLEEGRIQKETLMQELNAAVEAKETRMTELLVSIGAMELKVMEADKQVLFYQQEIERIRQEAADTVLLFSTMTSGSGDGGGGGGDGDGDREGGAIKLGVSEQEFESMRDMMDKAQEEVVELTDKCERLEHKLSLCEQRVLVFEQILAAQKERQLAVNNAAAAASAASASAAAGATSTAEVTAAVKAAIVKGTNFWKSNRRDEAFDLYLSTTLNAAQRLTTPALKQPLNEAYEAAKGTSSKDAKGKSAVALRKALDKLLVDIQQPALRQAEESAAGGNSSDDGTTKAMDPATLASEMRDLETQLEVLNSLYKNEQEPVAAGALEVGEQQQQLYPAASDTQAQSAPQQPSVIIGDQKASSLLKRAKVAESSVDKLKKQIAFILTATGNAVEEQQYQGQQQALDAAGSTGAAEQQPGLMVGDGSLTGVVAAASSGSGSGLGTPIVGLVIKPGAAGPVGRAPGRATPGAGAGAGGGADPAEVRKLQRRVKELEAQLQQAKSSGGDGGGDGGAAEKKALAAAEKQLQKKLKEVETAAKKEKGTLETRAIKAEKALESANALLEPVTKERDQLRTKVKDVTAMNEELTTLRKVAEQFAVVSKSLEDRNQELAVLSDQYKKETALRKKYKNELEDLKGAIRVFARCRPFAKYEIERGCLPVVQFKDESSLKVNTSRGDKEWEFDCAFGMDSTQEQVFEDAKRLVESCLDGYNVCIFAYGQTGSGKTFTMTGSPDLPGLTPRAINEIFTLIRERPHCQIKVSTYFVELYNDNLVDLYWLLDNKAAGKSRTNDGVLIEPPRLDIKLDKKKMVFINNVVMKDAGDPDELMSLFHAGNSERHVGATKMNAESSRSHSIFSIVIESYDTATKRTTTGKISLVDLAGSERADKTGAQAERLREAQSINKSLSALGDVIAALSEGEKFIPYRNNKLTQLMQDSLGGNAKTLMFVNFSPADYNVDETVSSLSYAARVKKIVNNASKQAESEEVARLKGIIKKLQSGQAVALEEAVDDTPAPEAAADPDA